MRYFAYLCFLIIIILFENVNGNLYNKINISQMYALKIEPKLFNWTQTNYGDTFIYRPSIEGYPDLPSWMRYMYSKEYLAGYLYGTPPKHTANTNVNIVIIGLNTENYETRRITLKLSIVYKRPAANIVQMKIDNFNWVDMVLPGRMENLKNLYRNDLWPESSDDLHLVFMESATKMGARLPLKPDQTEGVIVHLGSDAYFSKRLQDLQIEVKPLYKISSCNFKKTTVQRIFQNAGFILDWCAFRTIGIEGEMSHQSSEIPRGSESNTLKRLDKWEPMPREDAPIRNYIDEIAFAVAIPAIILAFLITLLTAVLCFQHEYIEPVRHPTVQMVQYSDTTNQPTTTLKSLKDTPNYLIDNISLRSQSPTSSFHPDGMGKIGNNYIRPKPPPYKHSPAMIKHSEDI